MAGDQVHSTLTTMRMHSPNPCSTPTVRQSEVINEVVGDLEPEIGDGAAALGDIADRSREADLLRVTGWRRRKAAASASV